MASARAARRPGSARTPPPPRAHTSGVRPAVPAGFHWTPYFSFQAIRSPGEGRRPTRMPRLRPRVPRPGPARPGRLQAELQHPRSQAARLPPTRPALACEIDQRQAQGLGAEEQRHEGKVQRQLPRIEVQRQFGGAGLPDAPRRVPQRGVQRSPHRPKHPVRGAPWGLRVGRPLADVRFDQERWSLDPGGDTRRIDQRSGTPGDIGALAFMPPISASA